MPVDDDEEYTIRRIHGDKDNTPLDEFCDSFSSEKKRARETKMVALEKSSSGYFHI